MNILGNHKDKLRSFGRASGRVLAALGAEIRRGNTRVITSVAAGALCLAVVCVIIVSFSTHSAAHASAEGAPPAGTPCP